MHIAAAYAVGIYLYHCVGVGGEYGNSYLSQPGGVFVHNNVVTAGERHYKLEFVIKSVDDDGSVSAVGLVGIILVIKQCQHFAVAAAVVAGIVAGVLLL